MNIDDQTITDAHTGITISFRTCFFSKIVEIAVGGKVSVLHFDAAGQIMSITPHAFKEMGVDPDSGPPLPPKGLTHASEQAMD